MSFLKKNWIVLLLITCVVGFLGWIFLMPTSQTSITPQTAERPLDVVASFYPIAEFARAVGGEFVRINTITPASTEPHEYEPTAEQITSVNQADVFLYNGKGVDAWAERIAPDLKQKNVTTLELTTIGESMIENPHVWLNPLLVQEFVQSIAAVFMAQDPTHAQAYQQNANRYIADLKALDQSYRTGLSDCQNRTVIASHDAFTHLSLLYHFTVVSIAGLSPEAEPSAGRLAEIAKLAKEKQVKFIYFETLASPKLSQTLASEVHAQTLVFNPIEGISEEDQVLGKNYLTIMQENLTNLKIGMVCQ